MGIEVESFVYPERISPELYCPICTQILENPVQTPTEHLFCEDELLEWMLRSDLCPVTKEKLDANSITKPGRIILNMLAGLERYCKNKCEGCLWTGPSSSQSSHLKDCKFKSKSELICDLSNKDKCISDLERRLTVTKQLLEDQITLNKELRSQLAIVERKVSVYEKFFEDEPKLYRPKFGDSEAHR